MYSHCPIGRTRFRLFMQIVERAIALSQLIYNWFCNLVYVVIHVVQCATTTLGDNKYNYIVLVPIGVSFLLSFLILIPNSVAYFVFNLFPPLYPHQLDVLYLMSVYLVPHLTVAFPTRRWKESLTLIPSCGITFKMWNLKKIGGIWSIEYVCEVYNAFDC